MKPLMSFWNTSICRDVYSTCYAEENLCNILTWKDFLYFLFCFVLFGDSSLKITVNASMEFDLTSAAF